MGASEGADIEHISIHALLAESDLTDDLFFFGRRKISIHALLAESDLSETVPGGGHVRFLSTLSLRRATGKVKVVEPGLAFLSTLSLRRATFRKLLYPGSTRNFYPRSPCGERRGKRKYPEQYENISIHALLAESDLLRRSADCSCHSISIHALLAESDRNIANGERKKNISIHALLAESDSKSAQNSGALLRIWNKFYGDCIFMLTGKAVFYPFCPCFFHIFWCEGTGNFMIVFPSH